MRARTTRRFRDAFRDLPEDIQERTQEADARFRDNPDHPGLRFKKIQNRGNVHAVRITRDHRALDSVHGDEVVWFWVGSHEEYEWPIKVL